MPRILASFCNVDNPDTLLGITDGKTLKIIGHPDKKMHSVTGITRTPFGWIVGGAYTETRSSALWFLDSDFKTLKTHNLKLTRDVHSISYCDDVLYLVSSGTDSIVMCDIKKDLEMGKERFLFRFNEENRDTLHLNSIYVSSKTPKFLNLLFSTFGLKDDKWQLGKIYEATFSDGGFAKRIVLKHTIKQPHTVLLKGEKIYYCESREFKFHRGLADQAPIEVTGYTRGIAVDDETSYIGLSSNRKISKHTGEKKPIMRPDLICGIVKVEKDKVTPFFEMPKNIPEIYDLEII